MSECLPYFLYRGNEELKRKYGLTIVGPKADRDRIPEIDVALGEGDTWDFGQLQMRGVLVLELFE